MPKRALSTVPPALRQTYDRDAVAVSDAVARLAATVRRGDDTDTDWEDDLPEERLPGRGLDVVAVSFPRRRK